MQQSPFSAQLIASAVFAAVGAAFIYFAAFGADKAVLHAVLLKVGCALGCFALAVQPSALFGRVLRRGLSLDLPKFQGIASLLNVVGILFFALAGLAWILAA